MPDTSSGLVGGRYRILDKLGKGAMGLVFMAHDPVLDRKVAIKQMIAEIADNEELRQRFYVEARAAARLNHPNIITIHELQESGGEIFMIMELLEGRALSSLVEAKPVPLSLETTLDVMAQVCDGLDYAHQKAIVHRDIKPANLFLTSSGTVKILDFGIARLGALHMTATGALMGTPDYMAPEQIRGDEIDRRTDLWAVGAVLYQLLSGKKPFEGRPLARLLSAISQTPHVPLRQRAPAVPTSVSDLVDRLLSKPRDGRPASAGLVRDELRAILGRESSSAARTALAQEGYEETVFSARPTAPGTAPAVSLAPPAVPLAPPAIPPAPPATLRPRSAWGEASIEAPQSSRAEVPETTDVLPPSGKMARTSADGSTDETDRTLAAPAGAAVPARPAVAAPTPAAVAAPAPASEKTKSSRLLVAAAIVAVLGMFGLAAWAGSTLWSWRFGSQGSGAGAGQQDAAVPPAPAPPATSPPPQTAPSPSPPSQAAPPVGETVSGKPASLDAPPVKRVEPAAGQQAAPDQPPAVTAGAEGARRQPAPGVPIQKPPAGAVPAEPPVETGVATKPGARPGVSQETLDALAGRQSGQGYDANTAASVQAAVARISYVLEQYVKALVNADADAIREYRSALSPEEAALMRAQQLRVRLEDVRIEVNGTEATARCRRKVQGTSATGAALQEDAVAVYHLVRRPAGWVITDVR